VVAKEIERMTKRWITSQKEFRLPKNTEFNSVTEFDANKIPF